MICDGFMKLKGFRYNPSDEELLSDLEQKIKSKDSQIMTIIPEIEVCKYEPRQLPELAVTRAENLLRELFSFFFLWFISQVSWHSQSKWYFFTPLDYKYINSNRINRTTEEGYWKITGKDRAIKAPGSKVVIGRKRTLTFYKRGDPKDQKTGWVIHEYFLIQECCDPPKQIGEYVVCCLKYKSDDSDHDKDAPFCNRGSSGCSMASNVENQAEENWVPQELVNAGNENEAETSGNCSMATNVVPIPNGNDYETETGGRMITEQEEHLAYKELEDALQDPIGNPDEFEGMPTDPCCIKRHDHSTSVEGQPDSNLSEMIKELLDDPESLDALFHPSAPPQPHQPHQSPMYTTNLHKDECRKRAYPFENDDPSLLKKNNISTDDYGKLVSNSTSNSENQAANVIPEGYSQPRANLGSDSYSFLSEDYDHTQPSINGGPRDFSNNNNDFIELDDLLPFCQGIHPSLVSDTVIDGGRGVTGDINTLVVHGSENDYSALAFGASLHYG